MQLGILASVKNVFFPGTDMTVTSQAGATNLEMRRHVLRIQGYLQLLCSSFRSDVMVAHRFTGHCSGRRGRFKH